MPPQFSHHNKGFINYVFCRNWAVRNPAGTTLDSSLVNKQVVVQGASVEGQDVARARGRENWTRPTSRSKRLVKEALVMKGLKVPPFGFPTQIAKEAGVVLSVRIAD